MNINIHSILTAFDDTYEVKKQTIKKPVINNTIDKTTNNQENTYDAVLRHICHNLELNVDEVKTDINNKLENKELLGTMNKVKILLSIEQNNINTEVILFLSGYFEINIYVYHTLSRILRVYYLENECYITKRSILLFFTQEENNPSFYQTTTVPTVFTHKDKYIEDNLSAIYTIPIGLVEKKQLSFSTTQENIEFFTDKVEIDDTFINDENILFTVAPVLEEYEVYDYRTFDVEAFNKRYNKKKMLMELYSLKSN